MREIKMKEKKKFDIFYILQLQIDSAGRWNTDTAHPHTTNLSIKWYFQTLRKRKTIQLSPVPNFERQKKKKTILFWYCVLSCTLRVRESKLIHGAKIETGKNSPRFGIIRDKLINVK